MKSPRSPRCVRSPSLMTIPEDHECSCTLATTTSTRSPTMTTLAKENSVVRQQQYLPHYDQHHHHQPQQQQSLNDPVFLINTERSRASSTNTSTTTSSSSTTIPQQHDDDNNNKLDRLVRNPMLDAMAYQHAMAMAERCDVYHSVSSIGQLQESLHHLIVGENVQRGDSVLSMHYETIMTNDLNCVNRSNILSPYFHEIGSAVVLARDGKLYCCQLFRG